MRRAIAGDNRAAERQIPRRAAPVKARAEPRAVPLVTPLQRRRAAVAAYFRARPPAGHPGPPDSRCSRASLFSAVERAGGRNQPGDALRLAARTSIQIASARTARLTPLPASASRGPRGQAARPTDWTYPVLFRRHRLGRGQGPAGPRSGRTGRRGLCGDRAYYRTSPPGSAPGAGGGRFAPGPRSKGALALGRRLPSGGRRGRLGSLGGFERAPLRSRGDCRRPRLSTQEPPPQQPGRLRGRRSETARRRRTPRPSRQTVACTSDARATANTQVGVDGACRTCRERGCRA
jgi:hypothetical protein